MFGGFDGSFYNDLNILDLQNTDRAAIQIRKSTISNDYQSLVNSAEGSDIVFQLNDL